MSNVLCAFPDFYKNTCKSLEWTKDDPHIHSTPTTNTGSIELLPIEFDKPEVCCKLHYSEPLLWLELETHACHGRGKFCGKAAEP